jgi:hypothetical protein
MEDTMSAKAGSASDRARPEAKVDELYRLPLAEFTAGRDALAARLKASGDASGAAEVKRLKKPSVPAWAANQVVRRDEVTWHRLKRAAEGLRKKQEQGAPADEWREASAEQRTALRACETRATDFLGQHGHAATPALLQKITHTLLALAYGAPDAVPGSLEQELQPPGFEAFAGIDIPPAARERGAPKSAADEAPDGKARAQAEARREAARAALAEARQDLARAEKRLEALQWQLDAAAKNCDEARARVESAEKEDKAAAAALSEG